MDLNHCLENDYHNYFCKKIPKGFNLNVIRGIEPRSLILEISMIPISLNL